MPPSFGLVQIVQMLAYTDNVHLRPILTSNSLAVLRRFVLSGNGATLIGAFGARAEVEKGTMVALPVEHALFQSAQSRLLVRSDRPLTTAADTLLQWITERIPMFG